MSAKAALPDGNATVSLWEMATEKPAYEAPVPARHHTQVCVVGAGISGLSVAYALAREGTRVTVVDDGPIGGGETGRTSAHLSCALDDRFTHLTRLFGASGARIAAESHRAAIDSIEEIAARHAILCDFRRVDGYLFAGDAPRSDLARELAAARRAGLEVELVEQAPLPFATGRCLRFADQAEFQPLAYLRGLAEAIIAAGGHIHTGVRVDAIEGGDLPRVRVAGGRVIHADAVVDATNASITSRFDLPVRQAAYRSYLVGLDLPAGEVPHALYWDTEEPYHYLRVARAETGREVLLVGGEDHRTGQGDPEACFDRLEAWARARFPRAGAAVTRWSGQIMEPSDAMGYVGPVRSVPNVFVVSGDSGNGLTNGALAGLLLPSLIRGDHHPWAALYAPTRSRLRGAGTLVREAISSTAPYTDWLGPSDADVLAEVPAGEGRVLRLGGHRIAAFRDRTGECHLRSAHCPHLHAVVRWNPIEQSWDCPAHGSRFDPCGRVVNSPSARDLSKLDRDLEASVRATETSSGAGARETLSRVGQGAYYLTAGLWPVVHFRSFAAITGVRGNALAIKLLGGLVAAVGAALLARGGASSPRGTRALGIGSAAALGVASAWLAARRGSRRGLTDTVVELALATGWLLSPRRASPHSQSV
jgi:glycine/D-amino acid oxidase-like deaminating enzyme/nitrite reductase/ring-hydroxylating ferredoxin subunit